MIGQFKVFLPLQSAQGGIILRPPPSEPLMGGQNSGGAGSVLPPPGSWGECPPSARLYSLLYLYIQTTYGELYVASLYTPRVLGVTKFVLKSRQGTLKDPCSNEVIG